MTNFEDLIKNRRSTRQYTEEQLTPSQVETIMQAALMAPSSKNSKPCQFVLVDDKETLKALSLCKSTGAAFIENCALAIVVLSDPLLSMPYIEDAAIAATYMQLQAEDLGLGSCWVQISGRETEDGIDSEEYVRELLNIPFQLVINCIISIGHKAKESKPQNLEKLKWEKLHIGSFRYDGEEL
ncbi:nitroreductase [Dysgonomonadaceae bacterium PH5-43]|nr:nitroreductase [Dysgonomonadaceae bacterium PH5-43]